MPTAAPGSAVSGDIVDASGKVDPTAYAAMAAKMSTAEGITYRYGSASSGAMATNSWFQRPDTLRKFASDGGDWQVGGPDSSSVGDYFANFGNAVYVPDAPGTRVGVADILTIQQTFNTFTQRPQPVPLWAGKNADPNNFNGLDDFNGAPLNARNPVAAARCYGRPGWCLESVVAYQNGLLSTATGSNTSANRASAQLPANKVPTAIAQTNSGEFALVTVWDTAAMKGQIAVVALAGLANGASVSKPDIGDVGWGEWGAVHPGLSNRGNTAFMKVLGYVDLPDSMRAPTEISATTGWNPWDGRVVDSSGGLSTEYKTPLANETNRQTYITGRNTGVYAKGGVAIVVSKSEKRVAFVDLKPLFDFYRRMYFGARADFDKTTSVGMADNQWPYAFSQMADADKPRIIQTPLDLGSRPTAVKATLWGSNLRAWVATQEGNLRLFDLGGWGNGSGGGTIKQTGTVALGPNPTSIAYFRGSSNDTGTDINNYAMVLSRGDRTIRWVDFSSDHNSGSVRPAMLTDSRLVDPVMIEDNENHGTEAWVLSLADYGGRSIRNYRYGSVIFWTNQGGGMACAPKAGCGLGPNNQPAAQYPFEYGGATTLPGKPFLITSANVP